VSFQIGRREEGKKEGKQDIKNGEGRRVVASDGHLPPLSESINPLCVGHRRVYQKEKPSRPKCVVTKKGGPRKGKKKEKRPPQPNE